jgi:hypothetical protein
MKKAPPPPKLLTKSVSSKVTTPASITLKSAASAPRLGIVDRSAMPKATTPASKPLKSPTGSVAHANGRYSLSAGKKRPRSVSRSESPPYKKRAPAPEDSDIGNTIWKMFGRDRNAYVGMDVLSDDEDMEADATILEREEKMRSDFAFTVLTAVTKGIYLVPASQRRKTCLHLKKSGDVKRRNVGAKRRRMRARGATDSNLFSTRLPAIAECRNILSWMLAAIFPGPDSFYSSAFVYHTDGTHSSAQPTCHFDRSHLSIRIRDDPHIHIICRT